jgi:hypothetical protein
MRGFYKYIRAFAARQPDCARSGAMRPNFGYCSHAIQSRRRSRISGRYRADSVLLSFPSPLTQRLRVIFGLLRVFNAEEI